MQRNPVLVIFSILLFCSYGLYAQEDSVRNNAWYFDDGGVSVARNVVKVNVWSVIIGDLPVYYERVLSKSLSIEVGAGILLPYYVPGVPGFFSKKEQTHNPTFGYSFWIHPKYYLQREAPELLYWGFQYRRRSYHQNDQAFILTDFTFNYGLQLILGKRFALDSNIGFGFRFDHDMSSSPLYRISGLAVPIGIKIGYIF